MLRPLLTWLLLLNYLLVVGAGLLVSRPPGPRFSAAHPYVHHKDCQRQNYLRLDCFERCNGDQPFVRRHLPVGTGLHYLAQLKGLDVHCPAPAVAITGAPVLSARLARHQRLAQPRLLPGFAGRRYPPPQLG